MRHLTIIFLFSLIVHYPTHSKMMFGYEVNEKIIEQQWEEEFLKHPLLINRANQVSSIEIARDFEFKNTEFLIAITFLLLFGIFKVRNRLYFKNILLAFRNPTLTARQLKDQLQQHTLSNLIMNLFFCISFSFYFYQVLAYFEYAPIHNYGPSIVIPSLILLFMTIYAFRVISLKLIGKVFNISDVSNDYSFQILLINKVLGFFLIPFTIVLAFGSGDWVQVILFLSFILVAFLLIYRYLRSGSLFVHFLRFSKFHFILYLCASEILPAAILIKFFSKI